MLKKPRFLSYSSKLLSSPTIITTRSYATTSQSKNEYSWPATPSFTPYDVLNIPRNAPYIKTQYYDLVKLYHPDRPHSSDLIITPEVRLQRYKIIVAAHEILSDPAKRTAYDISGTGWKHNRHPSFNHGGSGIYGNATWEDWERWNNRHNGNQANIVDSRTFTRLLVLLVLLGGAMQFTWIGQLSIGHEDRMRDVSSDSMRVLAERRSSTVGQMPSQDARVQSFLIRRDPTGSGLKDEEEGVYQRELHPRRGAADLSTKKSEK
ncbi:hypothetical protein N7495_008046 [Penicillium taxi]|uniref:uncharacterized protein n=1 Tax=Penicillium taxi TaxID=168475 RepID=UPI00254532A5|nr:uncharacterized protein N7495_008046 [Penicillium taxi]KAJ5888005.1 hypothetical protein N7495_008046 [Penicillium taxi]